MSTSIPSDDAIIRFQETVKDADFYKSAASNFRNMTIGSAVLILLGLSVGYFGGVVHHMAPLYKLSIALTPTSGAIGGITLLSSIYSYYQAHKNSKEFKEKFIEMIKEDGVSMDIVDQIIQEMSHSQYRFAIHALSKVYEESLKTSQTQTVLDKNDKAILKSFAKRTECFTNNLVGLHKDIVNAAIAESDPKQKEAIFSNLTQKSNKLISKTKSSSLENKYLAVAAEFGQRKLIIEYNYISSSYGDDAKERANKRIKERLDPLFNLLSEISKTYQGFTESKMTDEMPLKFGEFFESLLHINKSS